MPERTLSHLRALEAESIHIIREVAAEFERPVMLYSIGKDSSVMVRLAQKAFHPGPIPFPLLHVDTTYKFQEMIEFRDRFCAEIGVRLIVHTNRQAIDGWRQSVQAGYSEVLRTAKTRALLDALAPAISMRPLAERGATRRNRAPRSASTASATVSASGTPKNQRPEFWNLYNSPPG